MLPIIKGYIIGNHRITYYKKTPHGRTYGRIERLNRDRTVAEVIEDEVVEELPMGLTGLDVPESYIPSFAQKQNRKGNK